MPKKKTRLKPLLQLRYTVTTGYRFMIITFSKRLTCTAVPLHESAEPLRAPLNVIERPSPGELP